MTKLHKASTLAASYAARFKQPGTVDLSASGGPVFPKNESTVDSIEASGVRSFSAPGKTLDVKATENFLALGETFQVGDVLLGLPEVEAKYLVSVGKAQLATPDEVAAAQKPAKAGK